MRFDFQQGGRLLSQSADRRRFVAMAVATVVAARATAGGASNTVEGGGIEMVVQTRNGATTEYLDAPGARLYFEVSGSGPTLLLIPGGPVDADGWTPIVGLLEDRYTVVRYDPRGISRSRLDGPETVSVETHADDAGLLLRAIDGEPAFVLGHSGGGVIGLALVERHPELVRAYVAHEPPLAKLLPEADERRTGNQAIYDIYRAAGVGPAMARFMADAGMDEPESPADMDPEAQAVVAEAMARVEQNLDFFLGHYLMPITSYEPDFGALEAASIRIEVGVGEGSVGQETYDTALALADRLGTEPVVFPGDHVGMSTHPEPFVERLDAVLRGQ